jgi:hypothetical protein
MVPAAKSTESTTQGPTIFVTRSRIFRFTGNHGSVRNLASCRIRNESKFDGRAYRPCLKELPPAADVQEVVESRIQPLAETFGFEKLDFRQQADRRLFGGFEQKKTRFNSYRIAEPEKALFDWIYLCRQKGLPTPLDEINVPFLDVSKLRSYAKRFPRTVDEVVQEFPLERIQAA